MFIKSYKPILTTLILVITCLALTGYYIRQRSLQNEKIAVKSFSDIIDSEIRFSGISMDGLYYGSDRNELRKNIVKLTDEKEVNDFLKQVGNYRFSNSYRVADEKRSLYKKDPNRIGLREVFISLVGSTVKSNIYVSLCVEPETKVVTLVITEMPKGGGDKVLADYYCLDDEMYEYLNKIYLHIETSSITATQL